MEIHQFIKVLNNTEIGKGGTNDSYVLVSKKAEKMTEMFDLDNRNPIFINKKSGQKIDTVHITIDREFRINGLGEYYRSNNVNAGDEIIFEKQESEQGTIFYLNLNVKNNVILFQKNTLGFNVLNQDRLISMFINDKYEKMAYFKNVLGELKIELNQSRKKRIDSPISTDFYSISFNDEEIGGDLKNNEYIKLITDVSNDYIESVNTWQEYIFNY